MSNLSTLPKGDSAWLLRKAVERIIQQISDLETNIGSSTTGNSANTQIIFNDNGVLRGDPDLTFNTALNKLVATALESTTSLVVGTSATITGDLTVKTNVLKVDTTNNRVGINNASPAQALDVAGSVYLSTNATYLYGKTSGGSATRTFGINAANDVYVGSIDQSISNIRFNSGGGDWAVLNATGLGVGEAASVARLQPRGSTSDSSAYVIYAKNSGGSVINFMRNDGRFIVGNGTTDNFIVTETGNVGISVQPSASWTGGAVIQQQNGAVYANSSLGSYDFSYNSIRTASNSYVYAASSLAAARFQLRDGAFNFFTAPSSGVGGAGTAITFTPAMTLDSSGNLLVGTTTNGGNGVSIRPSTASPNVVLVGSDTSGGTAWQLYSTGTSSNRFYVTWAGVVNAVNTTISGISDARLKENVQDIDVGLGAILALKPRKFDWKAGKGKDIKGDRGFIAQEFEQVFPQLVDEWADPAPEGEAPYKSVRQDLIPVLVKAIQELAAEVNALKNA